MTDPPLEKVRKRSFLAVFRRRWHFVAATVALLAMVAAALALYVFFGGKGRLEAARNAARAKGYALSLGEIVARFPPIPDEANAARLYERAFKEFEAKAGGAKADSVPLFTQLRYRAASSSDPRVAQAISDFNRVNMNPATPLPAYMLADAKAFAMERREILDLVHRAAGIPDARYRDSWNAENWLVSYAPNLGRFHYLAELAVLAAWVDAEEGRPHESAESIRDAIAVARSLRSERAWGGLVVRPFAPAEPPVSSICEGLEHVLARTDISSTDLESLQSDLEGLAGETSARVALEVDLAYLTQKYDAVAAGELELRRLVHPADYFPGIQVEQARARIDELPFWLMAPVVRNDVAAAMEYITGVLDNADKPPVSFLTSGWPQAPQGRYSLAVEARRGHDTARQAAIDRVKLRCAAVALAALRFRNDTGKWPETLDALVPRYIRAVPIDEFSGRPLLYAAYEDRITVYSVGANGRDEFGSERYDCFVGYYEVTRDIPFDIYERGAKGDTQDNGAI